MLALKLNMPLNLLRKLSIWLRYELQKQGAQDIVMVWLVTKLIYLLLDFN
ncbi:BnaCnng38180D [Brassica napus]|uniref:BnaCnng38180D protein n=2 Tax=Brassica TaxID=3705 RepID=A0A078J8D5_BRANA|nr:BnaCnng38180D [Brassica napus]VDD10933.1 unnamed protein product [Brassica rapa]